MRRVISVVFCIIAGVGQAAAAGATSEGARGLADTFHRYLGPVRAGQADFIRVEPQGDAYKIALDFKEFARPLEALGFTLDSAEMSFLTEPLADGTWHVTEMQLPSPLTLHIKDEAIAYRFDGVTFDGIYDPALAAFTSFDETIGGMSTDTEGPSGKGTAQYGEQHITGSGIAAEGEPGGVDVTVEQTVGAVSMHQTMSMPSAAGEESPAPPQMDFSYGVDSGRGDVSIAGLKATKLLELWAYVVAHMQTDAPAIENDEIKTLLTDLLPFFQQLDEKGAVHVLKVTTPMGDFGMQDLSGGLSLSGLVSSSVLRVSLKLAGPVYPQALVPAWATQLIPDSLEVGVDTSGLDLDASARQVISEIDVSKKPWVEDSAWAQAGKLAMPEDGIKVTLGPTSIHGPVLDIQAEGGVTIVGAGPSGSFNVTVKGLDAAIALLKSAGGDPMATQALASLTLFQSWGKQASDGTTIFAIEIKEDGEVTVNGQMVKPATGKTL